LRPLNLLVLRCRDIEVSRAFYETFGLRFTKHTHGSGPEHYGHEDERGVIELYPTTLPAAGDATGLGFVVPSLEETARLLAAHSPGLTRDNPWGRSFVVRDPDGRRVEVMQAK
jgi:lactoylglutathione lyase